MIVKCQKCAKRFDDEFRTTICPHDTFAANDGYNNFAHHPDSYLESDAEQRAASNASDVERALADES